MEVEQSNSSKTFLGRQGSGKQHFMDAWLPKHRQPKRSSPAKSSPTKSSPTKLSPSKSSPVKSSPTKSAPKMEQKPVQVQKKEIQKELPEVKGKGQSENDGPVQVKEIKSASRPGVTEILQELQTHGSRLWKFHSGTKKSQRKFILDQTNSIHYEPTETTSTGCFGWGEKKKQVELDEITDIRLGWKTDVFNKVGARESIRRRFSTRRNVDSKTVDENTCFSIVYGPQKDTLNLMASNTNEADKWVRALKHLLATKQQESSNQRLSLERWLRKMFNAADADKTKSLDFDETLKLLKSLNIEMEEEKAKQLFDEANQVKENQTADVSRIKGLLQKVKTNKTTIVKEVLNEDEFITFYFKLFQRPEIQSIFTKYAESSDGFMSAEQLLKFFRAEQDCWNYDLDQVKDLIKEFQPTSQSNQDQLSIAGLINLLLSYEFAIFNQSHRSIYQDMTLPMTNYFIASSHNTYLIGNQLSGKSSVEGYVDAFKRGCRCVELDCWDGDEDNDNEPIIYHGHTLTTKILFKEVLSDAVVPYAFVTNPYPVILNIENHCSAPYQNKMVNHLKTILGEMLYTEEFDPDMTQLPSPAQLKGKVIVRGKRSNKMSSSGNKKSEADKQSSDDSDSSDDTIQLEEPNKLEQPLSTVITILQNSHFNSFEESKVNGKPYFTSSIGESKALKLVEEQGQDFVDYNKKQVTRIYPGATRTGSSNFNPISLWTSGCQLVALNYQTEDTPNFYNFVQFSENGGCGYVLKPEFLRDNNSKFNPNKLNDQKTGWLLNLKIISGQHLPKAAGESEVIDPYIKVKITGLSQGKAKYTTKVVRNNGFNPTWDENWDTFIQCRELAFLIFKVYDYSQSGADQQLAHYGIPLSALTTGYRHVHLVSKQGVSLAPSSLFVHVRLSKVDTSV